MADREIRKYVAELQLLPVPERGYGRRQLRTKMRGWKRLGKSGSPPSVLIETFRDSRF